MSGWKRKVPHLLSLLIFPILGLIYTYLNTQPSKAIEIPLKVDSYIPFIPIFVIPYIIWYAFIFGYMIYFCFKDLKVYYHALITIVIGEVICFLFYIFFQTTVPRPVLAGNDWITSMVQFIYQNDEPYNCFPSIHVLTTYVIMLAFIQIKKKHLFNTLFVHMMGILIILSTLFIKQHVVLDVIASIIIASVIHSFVVELATRSQKNTIRKLALSKRASFPSKQIISQKND
ncbi:phosphatase PAP2 family protein [Virgibacillus sp. MG-45]|uniref:phosphatase PAP2 family protein n=1 Tax=Virgibacillus sp. MG-45 TaxID=3102791 RepID=UPI002EDA526B